MSITVPVSGSSTFSYILSFLPNSFLWHSLSLLLLLSPTWKLLLGFSNAMIWFNVKKDILQLKDSYCKFFTGIVCSLLFRKKNNRY